ncbi:MAG: HNH endonuclease [Methanosarcinaceae archaeon]|nr:HNH endonuclease [Methanosarcinaceae archaeon]
MGFDIEEAEKLLSECGRRCCICGRLHRVQVHHIEPGDDNIENGIPLCPNCHDEVHTAYSPGRTTRTYSPAELKHHQTRTIEQVRQFAEQKDIVAGPSANITEFSKFAKSLILALENYNEGSTMLGIEGPVTQIAYISELLGIPAPIEIQTIPYPEGEVAPNPFLQNRFEGHCVIRFPDGSEESGKCAHVSGIELLVEARDSAIVALRQWVIELELNSRYNK